MPKRNAEAVWKGALKNGQGTVKVESGLFEGSYSFTSRFEEGKGTNPEELIGAALAGCFSMALSAILESAGHPPEEISTKAAVEISRQGDGFAITNISLSTRGRVPGIDEKTFKEKAEAAKAGCPVSKALKATNITLAEARLA